MLVQCAIQLVWSTEPMINKVIWFFFWWISQNPKCQQSIIYLCSKFKQTILALDSIEDLNFMFGIQTKMQPWLLIKKFIFSYLLPKLSTELTTIWDIFRKSCMYFEKKLRCSLISTQSCTLIWMSRLNFKSWTDYNRHAGYKWLYLLRFECQIRHYKSLCRSGVWIGMKVFRIQSF